MKTAEIHMGLDPETRNKILVAQNVDSAASKYAATRDEGPKEALIAMKKLLKILSSTPGAIEALYEREDRGSERLSKGGV